MAEILLSASKKFVDKAEPHTPPYKIHRYFARRPWNIFMELIKHYSTEYDVILDPFCGGGVTVYESIKLNRKVIACDLNPLSIFIIKNMFYDSISKQMLSAYSDVSAYLKNICKKSFEISCPDCKNQTIIHWYNLSHVVECPKCSKNVNLSTNNKITNGKYRCANKKCSNNVQGFTVARVKRKYPSYINLNAKCEFCKSNIRINVKNKILSSINQHITELEEMVSKINTGFFDEQIPLDWDRQSEDLLSEKGFLKFKDLFTKKNFLINVLLFKKINEYKKHPEIHQILRFVFSNSLRDTNIMSFATVGWQNGTPNTWAKHAYWTPAEFCEVNPYIAFSNSYKYLEKCITFNKTNDVKRNFVSTYSSLLKNKTGVLLKTGSVNDCRLPKNSVDVIITDPPYGSNVQYLELSQFWHMWNKDLYDRPNIDHSSEAVVNRKMNRENNKTYANYEENLFHVFHECYRVLKKNGKMVLTFNNKDLNSWLALLISVFRAGFHIEPKKIIFQDGVSHYKTTSHTKAKGSPFGDFIYEFTKDTPKKLHSSHTKEQLTDFINTSLSQSSRQYSNGQDRNEILIQFFNLIIPKLEFFINSSEFKEQHDIYNMFSKQQLHFLYE